MNQLGLSFMPKPYEKEVIFTYVWVNRGYVLSLTCSIKTSTNKKKKTDQMPPKGNFGFSLLNKVYSHRYYIIWTICQLDHLLDSTPFHYLNFN